MSPFVGDGVEPSQFLAELLRRAELWPVYAKYRKSVNIKHCSYHRDLDRE